MKSRSLLNRAAYCFTPMVIFGLVYTCASALMEALWMYFLQERVLSGAGAAYAYAAVSVWACLGMVVPAGLGAVFICRQTAGEIRRFGARRLAEEDVRRTLLPPSVYPVLLVSVMSLSLGLNVCISLLVRAGDSASSSMPGTIPGTAGVFLQALLYVLYMPLIEELVFRGSVFVRFSQEFSVRAAVIVSGALFGIYHASVPQGIYAFLMGMVFAVLFDLTGRFNVPWCLHGACNLAVLCMQWTGSYSRVCTPAWAAVFLAVAAMGGMTVWRICRKTDHR